MIFENQWFVEYFKKHWKWSTLFPYRLLTFNFRTPELILSSSLEYTLASCQISWLYLNKQEHRSNSKLAVFQFDSPSPVKNGKNLAFWSNQFLKPLGRVNLGWVVFDFGWVGGGKSPKSEPVRHFFAPFSHIFVIFSKTTGPISMILVPSYSSLQELLEKHNHTGIWQLLQNHVFWKFGGSQVFDFANFRKVLISLEPLSTRLIWLMDTIFQQLQA